MAAEREGAGRSGRCPAAIGVVGERRSERGWAGRKEKEGVIGGGGRGFASLVGHGGAHWLGPGGGKRGCGLRKAGGGAGGGVRVGAGGWGWGGSGLGLRFELGFGWD